MGAAAHTHTGDDTLPDVYCFGFGLWKHGFVRAYLRGRAGRTHFVWTALDTQLRGFGPDARLLVWGVRDTAALRRLAARHGVPIWHMEDGFLRSVGLGSDFNVPASLVLDTQGIYFDPNRPSDLEHILSSAEFSTDELQRARALRDTIVQTALSKYNFARPATGFARPAHAARVLLVPGQVEDDASIARGCLGIRTNLALLEKVRALHPDAYLIYKPHPDVLSGNRRRGALSMARARELADAVITDVPLPACLDIADEVHTMTSLVGFEALLRGRKVCCYGRPFYAGWGLTEDLYPVERRGRPLTLDMLVAGTLIRYPLYLSQKTWDLTTPEAVIDELREALVARAEPQKLSRMRRTWRKVGHVLRGVLRDGP